MVNTGAYCHSSSTTCPFLNLTLTKYGERSIGRSRENLVWDKNRDIIEMAILRNGASWKDSSSLSLLSQGLIPVIVPHFLSLDIILIFDLGGT